MRFPAIFRKDYRSANQTAVYHSFTKCSDMANNEMVGNENNELTTALQNSFKILVAFEWRLASGFASKLHESREKFAPCSTNTIVVVVRRSV
jgi:hypothetical protein